MLKFFHKNNMWIPQAIISLMLLLALNPENPYEYYILLRWVCCPVFAYLAFQAFAKDKEKWVWVLGVTAAIYNPVVPIHLTREIWAILNVLTIIIATASIFVLKSNQATKKFIMTKECSQTAHRYCHEFCELKKFSLSDVIGGPRRIIAAVLNINSRGVKYKLTLESPKIPSMPSTTVRDLFSALTLDSVDSFKVFREQYTSSVLWYIEIHKDGRPLIDHTIHCREIRVS